MRLYLSGLHGGHQAALDSDRLRFFWRCDWSVGVPGVECGIRTAVDCGYGRPVRYGHCYYAGVVGMMSLPSIVLGAQGVSVEEGSRSGGL